MAWAGMGLVKENKPYLASKACVALENNCTYFLANHILDTIFCFCKAWGFDKVVCCRGFGKGNCLSSLENMGEVVAKVCFCNCRSGTCFGFGNILTFARLKNLAQYFCCNCVFFVPIGQVRSFVE